MGKVKDSKIELRAQILALKNTHMSNCAIGRMLGIGEKCAGMAIKCFKSTGSNASRRRSARKSLSTSRTDQITRRIIQESPMSSSYEIQEATRDHFRFLQETKSTSLESTVL